MAISDLDISPAGADDLDGVNAVIERAVMTWDLPERVKRLTLPTYRYQVHDLDHLEILVARSGVGEIVGVAAWETLARRDVPGEETGVLLHGLYVDPARHGEGVGSRLIEAVDAAVRGLGVKGVLVKAQADAQGFFEKRGFDALPVQDSERDYPHRLWRSLQD